MSKVLILSITTVGAVRMISSRNAAAAEECNFCMHLYFHYLYYFEMFCQCFKSFIFFAGSVFPWRRQAQPVGRPTARKPEEQQKYRSVLGHYSTESDSEESAKQSPVLRNLPTNQRPPVSQAFKESIPLCIGFEKPKRGLGSRRTKSVARGLASTTGKKNESQVPVVDRDPFATIGLTTQQNTMMAKAKEVKQTKNPRDDESEDSSLGACSDDLQDRYNVIYQDIASRQEQAEQMVAKENQPNPLPALETNALPAHKSLADNSAVVPARESQVSPENIIDVFEGMIFEMDK